MPWKQAGEELPYFSNKQTYPRLAFTVRCLWAGAYLPKGLRFYFLKMFLAAPPPARGLEPGFPRSQNFGLGVHFRQRLRREGGATPRRPLQPRPEDGGGRATTPAPSPQGPWRLLPESLSSKWPPAGPVSITPVVDLVLGWASALAWLSGIDRAWRSGRRREVGLLRTRWGFSFWETLGPVHADRTPVSSGPAGRCRHESER